MLFSKQLLRAFALAASSVLAVPASENGLAVRAEAAAAAALGDKIKIYCPGGVKASIECEGSRCTTCCGSCCECVGVKDIESPKTKTETTIKFSPRCSGRCPHRKERRPHGHHRDYYPGRDHDDYLDHYSDRDDDYLDHYSDHDHDDYLDHYPDRDHDDYLDHYPDRDHDGCRDCYPDRDHDGCRDCYPDRRPSRHCLDHDHDGCSERRPSRHYPDRGHDGHSGRRPKKHHCSGHSDSCSRRHRPGRHYSEHDRLKDHGYDGDDWDDDGY